MACEQGTCRRGIVVCSSVRTVESRATYRASDEELDHQDGPRYGPPARTGDATGSLMRHRAPRHARLRAARRPYKIMINLISRRREDRQARKDHAKGTRAGAPVARVRLHPRFICMGSLDEPAAEPPAASSGQLPDDACTCEREFESRFRSTRAMGLGFSHAARRVCCADREARQNLARNAQSTAENGPWRFKPRPIYRRGRRLDLHWRGRRACAPTRGQGSEARAGCVYAVEWVGFSTHHHRSVSHLLHSHRPHGTLRSPSQPFACWGSWA